MNNDNFTKLYTFPREQIIFLSMALFKPVASSEKKVAAYWNPYVVRPKKISHESPRK